ncbi:MAG: glycogen debranching enzyme N-terminal domain-containing protein [Clostridia bacterium]|nr:glycogen debranching enzyme N-terminal domain-containing protein [Clostridia bacterium]
MIYKRDVNNIEKFRNTEYILTNNLGVYMNTSVAGSNFAPYHGLFIKQEPKNDQILLEKITEQVDFGDQVFDIKDYRTSEKLFGGAEYLSSFDNNPYPVYEYDLAGSSLQKKYKFSRQENVLCIDYVLKNNSKKMAKFTVTPYITKRGIFEIKRASEMKFNTTHSLNTVKVNLSITEGLNIYLKSTNGMKFQSKPKFENGVNYDLEVEPDVVKTYVQDLYIPGKFEAMVKAGHTATLTIFVSTEDIENKKINSYDIDLEYCESRNDKLKNINEAYHELRNMALIANSLHYIELSKKKLVLLESIPMVSEDDNYVKDIISSIEGNYLVLKRFKEAVKILESMMLRLQDNKYNLNNVDRCEAELLFIEALNRYIQESECRNSEIKHFYEYIKTTIFKYIVGQVEALKMDKDFLLVVDKKKYIKINCLWYNALRIFMSLQDKFYENSEYIYSITENVRNSVVNKFWTAEKGVLKYEINDEAYPNIDMIYAISLSYPVLHENIAMKIIDTIFKELYTPLGMRLGKVNSKLYDGFVYPHLMVHFLKSNLRQMGVTRATQKMGYNLVKDLLAEINKNVLGTVKYKYYEKNKKAYGYPINALTNAELIRMYDMLT